MHGIFVKIVDQLLEKSTDVIQKIEGGLILEDQLGETELNNFYNILGVIVCCHNIDEAKRLSVLEWSTNRLLQQLQICPRDNKEKMSRIIVQIKTVTKGLNSLLNPDFRAPLSRVLDYLVPLFIENYQHSLLTKQIIYFL
jgi:hypothetical protein